jgi:hypothetical protein
MDTGLKTTDRHGHKRENDRLVRNTKEKTTGQVTDIREKRQTGNRYMRKQQTK